MSLKYEPSSEPPERPVAACCVACPAERITFSAREELKEILTGQTVFLEDGERESYLLTTYCSESTLSS